MRLRVGPRATPYPLSRCTREMTEPHQSGDTEKTRDTAATPQFGERRAAGAASRNEQVLFEALVRQNADALFVYVQACARDAGLAEEVFQDTLVVAWERLADYDSRRPFAAWTRGIARRLLQAKRRERSMYRSLSDGLAEQLEAMMAQLLGRFLALRTSRSWSRTVAPKIRDWVQAG